MEYLDQSCVPSGQARPQYNMASSRVVLITGANTGIGLEAVKALLRSDRRYHILLAGRDINRAHAAAKHSSAEIPSKSTVEPIQIDVESDDSIQRAFEQVSSNHSRIDCLINNAGAQFDQQIQNGQMTAREAFNKTFDVNVTATHIMTSTFLPLLLQSEDPRLLFITSGLSSLEIASDSNHSRYIVPPAGLPKTVAASSYKSAKAGLNMIMVEWTRILKNDGVKVWAIAPGFLATGLVGGVDHMKKMGAGDASLGGAAIRGVVEGKRDADVGMIVREYDTPIQPW